MSKFVTYGLSGIFVCLTLGSYLSWLADRDAKMFDKYYQSTTQTVRY